MDNAAVLSNIDAALTKLLYDFVAAIYQVLIPTGGVVWIPIIADGVPGQGIDQNRSLMRNGSA